MLKSVERLRVSTINLVLVSALLLGALAEAALGSWQEAITFAVGGLCGLAGALYARRSGSRDVTRLNALEWRDERDQALAKSGFAVVGAVALLMVMAQFIIVVVTDTSHHSPFMWLTLSQLLILNFAFVIANSVAVRRG
jgi:hypothetical protein